MEQARKEKVPASAEGWGRAAAEKEKVADRDAAGDKAVDAAGGAAKVAAKHRGRAADRISRLLLEEGAVGSDCRWKERRRSITAWRSSRILGTRELVEKERM